MREKIEMSDFKRALIKSFYDLKSVIRNIVHLPKYISRIKKILINSNNIPEEHFLSIVVTIKNEAMYIKEWLDYHIIIGVDHFYIYDNGSMDNLLEVLEPYIHKGIVTYIEWKGVNQQLAIYEHALNNCQKSTTWMAILDADEFIVSVTNHSIIEFLKDLDKDVAQVMLGWMVFGSSGKRRYEKGLVLDRFRLHALDSWMADSKPIVKPSRFLNVATPHWVDVFGKTVNENNEMLVGYPRIDISSALPMPKFKFRINHYYSKSWEEFESKRNRGFADCNGIGRARKNSDFEEHDQNMVSDNLVDNIVRKLKLGNDLIK